MIDIREVVVLSYQAFRHHMTFIKAVVCAVLACGFSVASASSAKASLPYGGTQPYHAVCFQFYAHGVNLEDNEIRTFSDIRPEITGVLREAHPKAGVVAPVGPDCTIHKDITCLIILGITVAIQREGDLLFFSFARSATWFFRADDAPLFAKLSNARATEESVTSYPSSNDIPRVYVDLLPRAEAERSIEHILTTLRRLYLQDEGKRDGPPLIKKDATLFLNRWNRMKTSPSHGNTKLD